jgi:hypothetical protein
VAVAFDVLTRRREMKSIKGPAIFLTQFAGGEALFNSRDGICG